ncbi:hypothetical protein SeMB42_g07774 [Synchytrium endobioticum]|uniref:HPt domain-containing protein n=1 Tax=Synchytrium endobioticum TaxID=286115 RepID=A0A507D6Z1_9FUNG|nr:hypothetical protein SeMB42_g07774 [Synchytrium endobioticum]TPX47216.1 hypothetical protein SeLEV6574_g02786 [Synchytrium endobioticum]
MNLPADILDQAQFDEFIQLDDGDPTREFTKSIITNFYEQAHQTISEMEQALSHGDHENISRLGHFLKGSSAQIGLSRLRDTCEKIQNVGRLHKEDGNGLIKASDAIASLETLISLAKQEYLRAEVILRQTFGD